MLTALLMAAATTVAAPPVDSTIVYHFVTSDARELARLFDVVEAIVLR